MKLKTLALPVAMYAVVACSKPTISAKSACEKIAASGVATGCKEVVPGGLGAAADERWDASFPQLPGKGLGVYHFPSDTAYQRTVDSFEKAAMLTGPHRYGSPKNRIFVQASEELSLEDGKKLKALVESL